MRVMSSPARGAPAYTEYRHSKSFGFVNFSIYGKN